MRSPRSFDVLAAVAYTSGVELVVVLAITAAVFGLAGRLPEPRRVKRELARKRIQSIDSLVDGKPTAIRGTVALEDPGAFIVAPLSGRRCVYWLVTFDELGVGGDFVELGRVDAGCPFLIRQASSHARVVPDSPRLAVPERIFTQAMRHLDEVRSIDPVIKLAQSVCRRPNYSTSMLRATEYVIEPDMIVTISGWCTREPDPTAAGAVAGYRAQLPTRPVLSGSRRARLLIG